MGVTELPIYLLDTAPDSAQAARLEKAGILFSYISLRQLPEISISSPGGILLFNIDMPRDELDRVIARFGSVTTGCSMAMIALISGRTQEMQQEGIRRAFVIGAQDYILLDVSSAFVAERLRFLARHHIHLCDNTEDTAPTAQGMIDTVTGLPTWNMVGGRLDELLGAAVHQTLDQEEPKHGLIMINIDRFRKLTAAYGPQAGDSVLGDVASRLRIAVREVYQRLPVLERGHLGDMTRRPLLGRVQSDEFVVVMPNIERKQDCALLADMFLYQFRRPFRVQREDITLTASAGIAMACEHGATADALLRAANAAAIEAREGGGNCYKIYQTGGFEGRIEKFSRENRIRQALRDDEIQIYYQPQVDIITNRVIGMEALARWHHPLEGIVEPDKFIPLLEESGMADALGTYILRRATYEVAKWQDPALSGLKLSVNMNPQTFQAGNAVALVHDVLIKNDFDPRRLTLEVTESMVMDDPETVRGVITRLQAGGVSLALDDFGMGYSSLGYLKSLPFNYLKIDKGFTHGLMNNSTDRGMVEAIISMGKTLGMSVVCEGVENIDQLAWLSQEGCDWYQGYLCSKPLPAEEFVEFVVGGAYEKMAITA